MGRTTELDEALNNERHELALRASNEGIWDWDIQRSKLYYSDRILEFLKFEENQAPNPFESPDPFVHEEDRDDFIQELEQFLKLPHDTPLALEARLQRKDHSWCWMRIRGVAVRDSRGEPIRIAGSMIDITRRKNAETALEEERHLFRLLIENVPENIYFKDVASNFMLANSATAKKLGAESDEALIGTSDDDYFNSEHADRSRQDEIRIMETGVPIISNLERETWNQRKDTWVVTTKLPWYDRMGKIKGTFGITSDVSKLVNTREKLRRTALQLERRNKAYEEEIQLAREIQNALIPEQYPTFEWPAEAPERQLEFSHQYLPSSDLAGDHLDVTRVGPHSVAVVICDVMGHGIRSALIASMLRGLIEERSRQLKDPSRLLGTVNKALHGILDRAGITLFATITVALIDLETETITHSSAGHHPPLIIRGNHEVEARKGVAGPALGLLRNMEFPSETLPFELGDRLFLYTDGLTETSSASGEEWGPAALESKLKELSSDGIPTSDWIPSILTLATEHHGAKSFDDDVCLISVELRSIS